MPPVQIVPPELERAARIAEPAPSKKAATPIRNSVQAVRRVAVTLRSATAARLPAAGPRTDLGSHAGTVGSAYPTGGKAASPGSGTQKAQPSGAVGHSSSGCHPAGGSHPTGRLGQVGGAL